MFDKLENLLQQWLSVERRELILNAFQTLHDIGHEPAWGEISQYLEYATDDPLSVIIDTIETVLQVGLDCVLSAHAITVDGPIAVKTTIIRALLALQNYDDPVMIVSITEDSTDPINTMANLLELVTGESWVNYIDHLCIVSPTLITMIHDKYSASAESLVDMPDDTDAVRDTVQLARLRAFMVAHPNALVTTAVTDDMRAIGVSLQILLTDYKLRLAVLEPKAPDVAAMELMGLCLLSDIPSKDIARGVRDAIELVYTDINFITQVDIAVERYITEVLRNGQWTVKPWRCDSHL